MYLGKIVELTDRQTLFSAPLHPYSRREWLREVDGGKIHHEAAWRSA